ncbi:MAG: hypothetical protein HC877_18935 [Thioploca sp.]|nr:hypothetical protein [Thioploca sp.]
MSKIKARLIILLGMMILINNALAITAFYFAINFYLIIAFTTIFCLIYIYAIATSVSDLWVSLYESIMRANAAYTKKS